MHVTIRFFASHREATGRESFVIELEDGATAADAFACACAEHPALGRAASAVAFAVNLEHVSPETRLHDGDEVAFLPPVAGG